MLASELPKFRAYDKQRNISHSVKRLYRHNSINFKKYFDEKIAGWMHSEKSSNIPKFNNEDLDRNIPRIARLLDSTEPTDLIMNPPLLLQQFRKYLNENIPPSAFSVISNTYPPAFPQSTQYSEIILKSLIKIVGISQNPGKSLSWIINCIFPTEWKSRVPDSLKAASVVKTTDKSTAWVYLASDNFFTVATSFNNAPLKILYSKLIVKADFLLDRVTTYNPSGDVVQRFIPKDETHPQLWANAFGKRGPSFFTFLTQFVKPVPIEILLTLYKYFSTRDMFYVRAILQPGIMNSLDTREMIKAFLNVAQYSGKIVLFINTFLSTVFAQPQSTIDFLCGNESPLHDLYYVMFEKYSYNFFLNFGDKIIRYINNKYVTRLTSTEDSIKHVETTVFTAVKYILDSAHFLPMEFRILAAMLKDYSDAKFNKRIGTFRILADMFVTQFICPFIAQPSQVFRNWTYQNSDFPVVIANILNCVLTLSLVEPLYPQYERFDNRVLQHYVPQIFNFILDLANTEIKKAVVEEKEEIDLLKEKDNDGEEKQVEVVENVPLFGNPSKDDVTKSLEKIFDWITSNNKRFMDSVAYLRDQKKFKPSSAGWAIGTHIIRYFTDYGDGLEVVDDPPTTILSTTTASMTDEDDENVAERDISSVSTASQSSTYGFMSTDSEFTWTYDSRVTHDAGNTVFDDDVTMDTTFDALDIAIKLNMIDDETAKRLLVRRKRGVNHEEEESIKSLESIPSTIQERNIEEEEEKAEEDDEEEEIKEPEIVDREIEQKSESLESTKIYSQTTFNTGYTGETIDEYSYSITATTTATGDREETETLTHSLSGVQKKQHKRRTHSKQKNGTYTFTSSTNDEQSEPPEKGVVVDRDISPDKVAAVATDGEQKSPERRKLKIRKSKKLLIKNASNKFGQSPVMESITILAPDQNGQSRVLVTRKYSHN